MGIVDGTVQEDSVGALGAGIVQVGGFSTLDLNGYNTTLTSLVSYGTITDNSAVAGTTNLTLNDPTGNICIYGTIDDGAAGRQVAVTIASNAVIFTNACQYTGGTTIAAGAMLALQDGNGTTGSIEGNALVYGYLYFLGSETGFAGNISGNGVVAINSSQDFTLSGDNSQFTGELGTGANTTVTLGGPNALGNAAINLSDPDLSSNDSVYVGTTLNLDGYNVVINQLDGTGIITDDSTTPGVTQVTVGGGWWGGDIEDGAVRQLALNIVADGTLHVYNSNQYTGGTTIAAGSWLSLQDENGTTGSIEGNAVVNGTLFYWGSETGFAGNISGSGVVMVDYLQSFTLSGNISGGIEISEGTYLTLAGDNSYTGGTWVGSTLVADNTDALGSAGPVTIWYATLDLNGYNVSAASLVSYGGTITPGSGGPSILSTGSLTLDSGTQLVAAIDGGTAGTGYSQVQVNGQAYLGGATLVLTGPGAGSGSGPIVLITSTGGVTGTFAGLAQGRRSPIKA